MAEGTRIHLRYQKMQDGSYLSEEPLSMEYKIDGYTFIITGRADGIIVSSKKRHVIDEIKSTVIDLEEYYEEQKDWHLGQAKFYAYMYAKKNYMSEIAKMLGVNIGEEFIIQNADRKENVILAMDGLRIPFPHGMAEMDDGRLLLKVLQGHYEIIKLPWEPKKGDRYFYPAMLYGKVTCGLLDENTRDYTLKALGMLYRTSEEAEAHFADDYKRLTGKELDG